MHCNHQNTTFALWKDLLKTLDVMYGFIYNLWFIHHEFYMMGMGEKPRNAIKRRKKKRKPREKSPFGCPPIPRLRNGGRLFFRCPKTRRTYTRWERNPSLMGQKIQIVTHPNPTINGIISIPYVCCLLQPHVYLLQSEWVILYRIISVKYQYL